MLSDLKTAFTCTPALSNQKCFFFRGGRGGGGKGSYVINTDAKGIDPASFPKAAGLLLVLYYVLCFFFLIKTRFWFKLLIFDQLHAGVYRLLHRLMRGMSFYFLSCLAHVAVFFRHNSEEIGWSTP